MKIEKRHLIIIIMVLLIASLGVSYSYFGANVIKNNETDTKVNTGIVSLTIDEKEVLSTDIAPIYDDDYEISAYKKDFEVISSSTLNSCASLYLNINQISDSLKSEYFKYKLVYDGVVKEGNFLNASNNKEMLLLDNIFIENNTSKNYSLYIWISYQDSIDQLEMLGTSLNASLVIKGVDARNKNSCSE